VTRAAQDAAPWIQGLNDLGLDAQSLPLMGIGPATDVQAVHSAWLSLEHYHAIMFVSANAVRYFFQAAPRPASPWGQMRAWVTGLGSRAALLASGVSELLIDAPASDAAQWDSEALWAVIATQVHAGQRVLIVRGSDAQGQVAGRDWLSTKLQDAGVRVDQVAAYQRLRPIFTDAQCVAAAQAALDGSVWLFSNSEAIANLQAALPDQDWSHALAVATHPRIAQHARLAGWGTVAIAQPLINAVASSIKSIHEFRIPSV
jgi:uroporphyrinogen-III synthase